MPDPNKIEGGRWDRVLRSLFNLKGQGSTSARISDDISPTFNFPWRIEDDFLLSEKRMLGRVTTLAAGALLPYHAITNISPNHLVIVEGVWTEEVPLNTFSRLVGVPIPFTASFEKLPRDTRWGAGDVDQGGGVVTLQGGNVGAQVGAIFNRLIAPTFVGGADSALRWNELNFVLTENNHVVIQSFTANVNMAMTWLWREHVVEPGELN